MRAGQEGLCDHSTLLMRDKSKAKDPTDHMHYRKVRASSDSKLPLSDVKCIQVCHKNSLRPVSQPQFVVPQVSQKTKYHHL